MALLDAVRAIIGLSKDGSSPQAQHVRDLTQEIHELDHRLRAIEAVLSAVAQRSGIRPEELEPRPVPLVASFVHQLLRRQQVLLSASEAAGGSFRDGRKRPPASPDIEPRTER